MTSAAADEIRAFLYGDAPLDRWAPADGRWGRVRERLAAGESRMSHVDSRGVEAT